MSEITMEIRDKIEDNLIVMNLAVEGASRLLTETASDEFAAGLVIAFERVKTDVESLLN